MITREACTILVRAGIYTLSVMGAPRTSAIVEKPSNSWILPDLLQPLSSGICLSTGMDRYIWSSLKSVSSHRNITVTCISVFPVTTLPLQRSVLAGPRGREEGDSLNSNRSKQIQFSRVPFLLLWGYGSHCNLLSLVFLFYQTSPCPWLPADKTIYPWSPTPMLFAYFNYKICFTVF